MTGKHSHLHWSSFYALVAWMRAISIMALVVGIPLYSNALQGKENPPLTLTQLRELLSIGAPDATIAHEIESRGIAFQPSVALLNELQGLNAGEETLATLRKLIPAEQNICDSFGACMSGGQRTFHDRDWNQARAYFAQAATINPNSGQAWNSAGKSYLALQQTQAAYSAWDKALNSGSGVALTACMENGKPVCEGGTLVLTPTTLLRYKGDERVFEAPLSAIRVIGTIRHGSPSYLAFETMIDGRKYDFDFFPITITCVWSNVLVCPAAGQAEQLAMANYFDRTLRQLSSGRIGGGAIAPAVEPVGQRDTPPLRITVLHRHKPIGWGFPSAPVTYCQGVLSISMGMVEYDCTVPDTALGRCEHGMISPVRSVEYKSGGLRIAGSGGNWDFSGNSDDLRRAHDAIAATLAHQ